MSIETELEALLPEKEYIAKWKTRIEGQKISFYLKVKLTRSDWSKFKAKDIQKLLDKHNIPVDKMQESFFVSKITYSGKLEETGSYKLRSEPPLIMTGEKITLKVTKEGEGLGRIADLMDVIKDYISAH